MIKRIVLASLFFLFALIAQFPANLVLPHALPANLQAQGFSGSIWQGQVQSMHVANIPIKNIHWDIRFSHLLLGRVAVDLHFGQGADIRAKGQVAYHLFSQQLSLTDGSASLELAYLIPFLQLPLPVVLDGQVKLTIPQLTLTDPQTLACHTLAGTGQLLHSRVMGRQDWINFADFDGQLRCGQQGTYQLAIKPNNLLGLDAQLQTGPNQPVVVSGQFKLDPSLPAEVSQAAKFFGPADADGVTRFSF